MDLAPAEAGGAAALASEGGQVDRVLGADAGGSRSIIGLTKAAARGAAPRSARRPRASRFDCLAIEAAVRSTSLKKKIGPRSVRERRPGRADRAVAVVASRRSSTIFGWSIETT